MDQLQPLPMFLLQHGMTLIPGITGMMVVYYDNDSFGEVMLFRENYSILAPQKIEYFDPTLVKAGNFKQPWQWLTDSEMPFNRQHKPRGQNLTLWDDEKIRNLQINLYDKDNQHIITCYFIFSDTQALFGNSGDSKLSTQNKHLVSNILYNHLQHLREHYSYMLKLLEEQQNYLTSVESQLKYLYQRIQTSQIQEKRWIVDFCRLKLEQLSQQYGLYITISDSAMQEILNLANSASMLADILSHSVEKLKILNPTTQQFVLEPWHILAHSHSTVKETVGNNKPERAVELLDRLERASNKVLQKKLKLTSVNVGLHCDEPITAPAISDALKKNAGRISQLMHKNPDRWPLLRKEFKPIRNILDKSSSGNVAI